MPLLSQASRKLKEFLNKATELGMRAWTHVDGTGMAMGGFIVGVMLLAFLFNNLVNVSALTRGRRLKLEEVLTIVFAIFTCGVLTALIILAYLYKRLMGLGKALPIITKALATHWYLNFATVVFTALSWWEKRQPDVDCNGYIIVAWTVGYKLTIWNLHCVGKPNWRQDPGGDQDWHWYHDCNWIANTDALCCFTRALSKRH
jgi:hypothetical protein